MIFTMSTKQEDGVPVLVATKKTGAIHETAYGISEYAWTVETRRVNGFIITSGWLLLDGRITCASPCFELVDELPADTKRVTMKTLKSHQAKCMAMPEMAEMEALAIERLKKFATNSDKDAIGCTRLSHEVLAAREAMARGDVEAVFDCLDAVAFAAETQSSKRYALNFIRDDSYRAPDSLVCDAVRFEYEAYIRALGVTLDA